MIIYRGRFQPRKGVRTFVQVYGKVVFIGIYSFAIFLRQFFKKYFFPQIETFPYIYVYNITVWLIKFQEFGSLCDLICN